MVNASTGIAEATIIRVTRVASLINTDPDLEGGGIGGRRRNQVGDKRSDTHDTGNEANNINDRHYALGLVLGEEFVSSAGSNFEATTWVYFLLIIDFSSWKNMRANLFKSLAGVVKICLDILCVTVGRRD